jgi:hypothetical protein
VVGVIEGDEPVGRRAVDHGELERRLDAEGASRRVGHSVELPRAEVGQTLGEQEARDGRIGLPVDVRDPAPLAGDEHRPQPSRAVPDVLREFGDLLRCPSWMVHAGSSISL